MMKLLTETTQEQFIATANRLRKLFATGDAKAGYALSVYIDPHNEAIPFEWRQSIEASESELNKVCVETFKLLQLAAQNGDGEAMHLIAQYYQGGILPVAADVRQFREWCERAVNAGYAFAGNDLYSLYRDSHSPFYDPAKAEYFLEIINRAGVRVVR